MQPSFSHKKYNLRAFLNLRWLIILTGLAVQLLVLGATLANLRNNQTSTDITLTPVAGSPGICQVSAIRPFSNVWLPGVQLGMQIQIIGAQPNDPCAITTRRIQLEIVGWPGHTMHVTVQSPPVDFLDIAIAVLLAIIFDVTGIAVFLRAQNRQTARVTYALFTCTALILCLLNLRGANDYWFNLLGFTIVMLVVGLSVTFVCLFPYPLEQQGKQQHTPIWPYIPLLIAVTLATLSAFIPALPIPAHLAFIVISGIYNSLCVLIVIGVMIRGLRHLHKQERQFVRMVVIGLLFLLIPLALNLNLIYTDAVAQKSLLHLIPIPLAVLPLACDYALFRRQLLGTTSMLSRQAMRGLLWLLLASAFLFPSIILIRSIASLHPQAETLDYMYAGLLAASLICFPLLWSKVRDVGDQVFYQDFYQYNRSLHDLSAALTRLQGIEQISAFMLPRLAALLNTTESSLLLRVPDKTNDLPNSGNQIANTSSWRIYHHNAINTPAVSPASQEEIPDERLTRIANRGMAGLTQHATGPLLLDGVLLLALYTGNWCSGFLCLGPKSNLEPYSKEDYSFLSTLASQLSVLVVNSRYLEQAQADAQQLAALNHRVLSAQEEERRHLALELHDEALQHAMLVVRQLSDAGTMSEVAEVMPLARSVVVSLRRTCLELRPPLLDELGLAEAFRWLAHSTEEHSKGQLTISVACPDCWDTRPPDDVELALYRVGQEALSNIFKYAGASRVAVRLRREACGAISLLISDNGRGMHKKHQPAESLGLIGMYERMAAIGGTLQIRTSPGRGVTIRATWSPEQHDKTSRLNTQEEQKYRGHVRWEKMRL
ncbi:MAG: sensor histidine kinase [Ktedonobacteraceae bacterium]